MTQSKKTNKTATANSAIADGDLEKVSGGEVKHVVDARPPHQIDGIAHESNLGRPRAD